MSKDDMKNKKIVSAETIEIENREREIKLLINVIEPDPEYQPIFISDEACFLDISGKESKEIESRLEYYLKIKIPLPLTTPLWVFVDELKKQYPEWPEEGPVLN